MKSNIDAVKAKVAKAQEQLETKLTELQTSDDWARTLERMALLGPTSINRYYAEHRTMPCAPFRSAVRRPARSA